MKFILVTVPSHYHIGTFILNLDNRTWTFRYTDDFIFNGNGNIEDFPDVTKTYGHEACVKWLAHRVSEITPDKKGIRLAERLSYGNKKISDMLEIHSVQ